MVLTIGFWGLPVLEWSTVPSKRVSMSSVKTYLFSFLNRSHRGIVSNFLNVTFVQYSYLDFQPLELVAVLFH